MAFTPAEESRLRVLLGNDNALNTLAQNEPAIIQELGAQDVTIDELQIANTLLQTDKMLGRFGGEDKAVVLSVIRSFMNNGMASLRDLESLLPKRRFSSNDFIRIPDEPGGLIIQWGSGTSASNGQYNVTFPATFPNAALGAVANERAATSWSGNSTVSYGIAGMTASNMAVLARVTSGNAGPVMGAGLVSSWVAWGY